MFPAPDGVNAGQEDVQSEVELGLVDQQRPGDVALDAVRSLGEFTREVNCPEETYCNVIQSGVTWTA